MIKTLFIIHDLSYGGAEKVLVNLANNLDKTKYEVYVQTLFDVGVNREYLNDDVHYIRGWKKMFKGNVTLMKLFSPEKLCKWLIKDDYDIIVSFLEGPCARIASAYDGKKVAWIHVEHKSTETAASSFRSINEMKNCYKRFDKIVCVAQTVKENFEEITGINNCSVLYNVNQTDDINSKGNENQDVIIKSDDCFNIVSVGRLSIRHKGFDRLIRIHKKLLENGISNKLYILGEGENRKELEELILKLDVSDSCFLLGFNQNPYKYVKNADLFVCSSHKEGFSTAVTEALILGVPVVSTEVSGAKELLGENNEYGIVCDNDEEALYEAVYKMLGEKNLLSYYKSQAEIRGKEFSAEKTTKAVEEMLDSL